MSDKTTIQKSFKLDQVFMNNVEKSPKCIFKSGRLSLQYFEYVNTLFGSLSSQNIENQQITSVKYTVLMLCVHQNGGFWQVASVPRVIRVAKMFGCSHVSVHSLVNWLQQAGISTNAQDRPLIYTHALT